MRTKTVDLYNSLTKPYAFTPAASMSSYYNWREYDKFDKEVMAVIKDLTIAPNLIDMRIKDVIFNPPATIVFWADGTKTVVKCHDEEYDWEKGIAMAFVKKFHHNKGNYNNVFKRFKEKGEAANENRR